MHKYGKKVIAPLIITGIVVIYLMIYAILLAVSVAPISFWFCIVSGVIPMILAAVMIAVCIERIKEIRSKEEDDLSQY